MRQRVTVSIVNWNTRDALARCLRALEREAPATELHVVVVDNASDDGSAEMVGNLFPWVQLIALDHNTGFAGGNNAAIEVAPADYVLVLNPDVEVLPGTIAALLRFLEANPDVAAAGPALVDTDGSVQSHLYRRFPTVTQILLFWTILEVFSSRIAWLRRRVFEHDLRGIRPVPVDQIPGAAILIRTRALEDIGPLDDGFFVWFEDVDWCYRARQAGYQLVVLPAERMTHEGGASFQRWNVQTRVFQFYRAFFRFLCKHRLERLIRVALPILLVDLSLKERILRARRLFGYDRNDAVPTLMPVRRAVREIVRRYRAGDLVDFDSAGLPEPRIEAPVHDSAVDAIVVNWNGCRFLPGCLAALQGSTAPVRILVVDNGSDDGSLDLLRAEHPDVAVLALGENVGYAAAANAGLHATSGEYAIILNPDVHLAPDHLAALAGCLDADPSIGAAQGKLYQVTAADFVAGRFEYGGTLDSAGHVIRRSRMVVDRGQGLLDAPEFDRDAAVFSACGAALFLRRAMLHDLSPDGAYFDESFFSYKEDIDLCWRARILGWDIRYVSAAVAHHVRGVPLSANAWRALPPAARRHSWKNHYLLMLRNDRFTDLLRSLPFVLAWEAVRFGHALLRDPAVLTAGVDLLREARPAWRARRELFARRRTSPEEVRRWFGADVVAVTYAGAGATQKVAL